jgi:hypothetical protein
MRHVGTSGEGSMLLPKKHPGDSGRHIHEESYQKTKNKKLVDKSTGSQRVQAPMETYLRQINDTHYS